MTTHGKSLVQASLRRARPEHGCLHLVCRDCGYSEIVAFSCKKRGFCASCSGRRMADTAAHLEQSVLPRVPIRHWICSLPWGLRALLGYDRKLCSEVVSAFMTGVDVWRDGTRALVFEPHDLIARLVAAVPPPRFHLLRYFGVLSSHSSRRALVVPTPPPEASANRPPLARGDQLDLLGERDDAPAPRKRWAWLCDLARHHGSSTKPTAGD